MDTNNAEARAAAAPAELMKTIVAALESGATPTVLTEDDLEGIYAGACAELQAGRLQRAQLMFQFLNGQVPLDPRFAEGLGIACVRLGDFVRSIPFLALASYLRPSSPVPMLHMADAMAGLGERRGAVALLSASAALADLDPRFGAVGDKARARLQLLNGDAA
jgi:Flp pilus assembly protein TadD